MNFRQLSIGGLLALLLLGDVQAQGLRDAMSDRRTAKSAAQLGAELLADLPYGQHERQRLDVYRPLNARSAPILLMVHCGAWDKGDKRMDRVVEQDGALVAPGIPVCVDQLSLITGCHPPAAGRGYCPGAELRPATCNRLGWGPAARGTAGAFGRCAFGQPAQCRS